MTFIRHLSEPQLPQRVVILGGGGFLGHHLVDALRRVGGVTLAPTSGELDLRVTGAGESLANMLLPTDAIVFLSATKAGSRLDHESFVENIAMGAALCQALQSVTPAHVVYLSSDSVYPFTDTAICEQSLTAPTSLYPLMHLSREVMLANLANFPLAVLRVTQVYGVDDPHGAYGPRRMVRSALSEGKIALYGAGEETRDHIHVDDVVDVILKVLMRQSAGMVNVATGCSVSFADLANLVAAKCAVPVRIERTPAHMPVTHRHFDIKQLQTAFPERLQTPLERGLEQLIAAERLVLNEASVSGPAALRRAGKV